MPKLSEALTQIKTAREAREFLELIMTTNELQNLENRWQAIQLFLDGATHRAVANKLTLSIATASRVAKVAKSRPKIFELILDRTKHR